jgi:hypothetical protein
MDHFFAILLLSIVLLVPPVLLVIGVVTDFVRRKLVEMRNDQRMGQALRRGLVLRGGI